MTKVMSRTLTAEEKLNKFYGLVAPHITGHKTAMNLFFEALEQIQLDKEAYCKAKVESITDEIIKREGWSETVWMAGKNPIWRDGAKWFKQKLLEQ